MVRGRITVAIRCPQCGELESHVISLFDFAGGKSVKLQCSCSQHKLTVYRRQPGRFCLQIPCYLCDGMHFITTATREFWAPAAKELRCTESGLPLGLYGSEEALHGRRRPFNPADAGSDLADFFDNPEAMYQVLAQVRSMAEAGNLACSCSNRRIEIEIYPDRLELRCPLCRRALTLYARNDADVQSLKELDRVEMSVVRSE